MSSVAERHRMLEEHAAGGRRAVVSEVVDVPASDLRQAEEHDVALLLVLGELCARAEGGESAAPTLLATAARYVDTSFLHTGRILPRTEELIGLLDRAVRERSLDLLVEVADHFSQGWAGYADSVFPAAFARLAAAAGLAAEPDAFARVSFTLWREGLAAAAGDDPERAVPLFRSSLERYRKYRYYADASWLHTDLVVAHLLAGRREEAAAELEAQRSYVEKVLAEHAPTASGPGEGRPFAFHLGDVRSGRYSTFVESAALRPTELTERDRALLLRYVRASESLLSAARYGARRDFDAALDVFAFGWAAYRQSPYPRIFRQLGDRYLEPAERGSAHLTAYENWHRMLRGYRVRVKPGALVATAATLHDRLSHAGLHACAALVLLDTAVLHARLHGRRTAVEWVARYLRDLRPVLPEALGVVSDYLQAPRGTERGQLLSRYIGLRAAHLAPEFLSLDLDDEHLPDPNRLEVALYGPLLSIEGVTVHERTPQPLVDVLRVLGQDWERHRAAGTEPPYLSAGELAERTGRTAAALAQTVRRFRMACQERLGEVADLGIGQDAVIQGRPGYRLNPRSVHRFTHCPTDAPGGPA
ncbi:hypothetical protein [Streptomyces abyssomicinicus]|uniref:hypothetical protein n=1 Tax=Streptomyces abyssomicinicus TaxID=574929 RepID=UPI00159DD323|nr:hypothetical protein [Streptomyces abyssomicinicus]